MTQVEKTEAILNGEYGFQAALSLARNLAKRLDEIAALAMELFPDDWDEGGCESCGILVSNIRACVDMRKRVEADQ